MTQVRQPLAVMRKRIQDATTRDKRHMEWQDGGSHNKRQKTNDDHAGERRTEDTVRSHEAKEEEASREQRRELYPVQHGDNKNKIKNHH